MRCITIIFILISLNVSAQKVDQVLADYFESTGGLQRWSNLRTIIMRGKSYSSEMGFDFTLYRKAPDMMKLIYLIQGKEVVSKASDGNVAWYLNPLSGSDSAIIIDEEPYGTPLESSEFEEPFINYQKKGYAATLAGMREMGGKNCYKVVLSNQASEQNIAYYFAKDSHYLMAVESTVNDGDHTSVILTLFEDFHDVNGYILPYNIEEQVNGRPALRMIAEQIEVNRPLADELFRFPASNRP